MGPNSQDNLRERKDGRCTIFECGWQPNVCNDVYTAWYLLCSRIGESLQSNYIIYTYIFSIYICVTKLEMNPPLVLPSARSGAEELDEVIRGHIEQSIQIDSSEAELLERPLLRHPRRHFRFHIRLSQKRTRIHKFIERDEGERERICWCELTMARERISKP